MEVIMMMMVMMMMVMMMVTDYDDWHDPAGEKGGAKHKGGEKGLDMVINIVNIRFSSLLTSLTLGKNHPNRWTEEEDKTPLKIWS